MRVFNPDGVEVREYCFLYKDLVDFVLAQNVPQVFPAFANYFDFSSGASTTIAGAEEWVKLNADTVQGFSRNGLVHTQNRLTYTGVVSKVFKVEGIVSLSSGANNSLRVAFFKNGSLWPCSEQDGVAGAGGRTVAIPFHCLMELGSGDYVEVFVRNMSGTSAVVTDNVNVILTEM